MHCGWIFREGVGCCGRWRDSGLPIIYADFAQSLQAPSRVSNHVPSTLGQNVDTERRLTGSSERGAKLLRQGQEELLFALCSRLVSIRGL